MWADYFTKLLQGATFRKFRDTVMNCNFVCSDVHPSDHRSVLDPKRANDQSHTNVLRLKQNHWEKQTESEEAKDLIQPHKKKRRIPGEIASYNFRSGNYRFVFPPR